MNHNREYKSSNETKWKREKKNCPNMTNPLAQDFNNKNERWIYNTDMFIIIKQIHIQHSRIHMSTTWMSRNEHINNEYVDM